MKKISICLFAAAALLGIGCDDKVPEPGTLDVPVQSVTLDDELSDGVTLEVGQTLDVALKVNVEPYNATDLAETFYSSNVEVATVTAKGVVTAQKPGITMISIYVGGFEVYFTITVVDKIPVYIEEMVFVSQSKEVEIDSELNLMDQLSINPTDQNVGVIFESSNTDVATVDSNGVLHALKVGKTVITATPAAKENDSDPDISVTMEVQVIRTVTEDCDRTGWTISATSHSLPTTPTKNSVTAAFDDDANGTSNFGLTRPGKNSGGVNLSSQPDIQIWFVVDMTKTQKVNYLRIRHISTSQPDYGTRWHKFVEILGSDTGEDGSWNSIATNVNFDSMSSVLGNRDTGNVSIPTAEYRYLKFVGDKSCFDTTGNTAQINELYLGLESKITEE